MSTFGFKADAELQAILAAHTTTVLVRNAPDRLFREGDKSDGVYVVKKGALRLTLEVSPGKVIMSRVVGLGYVVGLPASINGHRYSLNCDVVEDAELAYISRRDLAHVIQNDTAAAIKLLDLLSCEIQALRMALAGPRRIHRRGFRQCAKKELN